jgi:hypothetical protein
LPGKDLAEVARAARIEVLSDHDGHREIGWQARDDARHSLDPARGSPDDDELRISWTNSPGLLRPRGWASIRDASRPRR